MQYVQSKQAENKQNMIHNGYRYFLKQKSNNKNTEYWFCTSRRTCKARAVTLRGKLIKFIGEHTHPVDGRLRTTQQSNKKLETLISPPNQCATSVVNYAAAPPPALPAPTVAPHQHNERQVDRLSCASGEGYQFPQPHHILSYPHPQPAYIYNPSTAYM